MKPQMKKRTKTLKTNDQQTTRRSPGPLTLPLTEDIVPEEKSIPNQPYNSPKFVSNVDFLKVRSTLSGDNSWRGNRRSEVVTSQTDENVNIESKMTRYSINFISYPIMIAKNKFRGSGRKGGPEDISFNSCVETNIRNTIYSNNKEPFGATKGRMQNPRLRQKIKRVRLLDRKNADNHFFALDLEKGLSDLKVENCRGSSRWKAQKKENFHSNHQNDVFTRLGGQALEDAKQSGYYKNFHAGAGTLDSMDWGRPKLTDIHRYEKKGVSNNEVPRLWTISSAHESQLDALQPSSRKGPSPRKQHEFESSLLSNSNVPEMPGISIQDNKLDTGTRRNFKKYNTISKTVNLKETQQIERIQTAKMMMRMMKSKEELFDDLIEAIFERNLNLIQAILKTSKKFDLFFGLIFDFLLDEEIIYEIINMRDHFSNTPLLIASKLYNGEEGTSEIEINILKELLKFDASALKPDSEDCYPLDVFCMKVNFSDKNNFFKPLSLV